MGSNRVTPAEPEVQLGVISRARRDSLVITVKPWPFSHFGLPYRQRPTEPVELLANFSAIPLSEPPAFWLSEAVLNSALGIIYSISFGAGGRRRQSTTY